MCTELEPGRVMVCDVAIGDVKAALRDDPAVSFQHVDFEGTLVSSARPSDPQFRRRVGEVIARHGGSLPDIR